MLEVWGQKQKLEGEDDNLDEKKKEEHEELVETYKKLIQLFLCQSWSLTSNQCRGQEWRSYTSISSYVVMAMRLIN